MWCYVSGAPIQSKSSIFEIRQFEAVLRASIWKPDSGCHFSKLKNSKITSDVNFRINHRCQQLIQLAISLTIQYWLRFREIIRVHLKFINYNHFSAFWLAENTDILTDTKARLNSNWHFSKISELNSGNCIQSANNLSEF